MDFFITLKEAATLIGCKEDTVLRLKKHKIIEGKTVKGIVLLDEGSVKGFSRAQAMVEGGKSKDTLKLGRPFPTEREYNIFSQIVRGDDFEVIAERFGIKTIRVAQLANQVVTKARTCVEWDLNKEKIDLLEQENKSLKNQIEGLKLIIKGYEERLEVNG